MSSAAGPRLLGAVMAGGRSRRLGRDKSVERVGSVRMVDRAVRALEDACDEVVVVSSRADTARGRWRVLPDRRGSPLGPLAGIETALIEAHQRGYDGVFVLACDLPLVDSTVVTSVVEALGDAEAVAPRRVGEPGFEPLCALYRTRSLATVTALLDRGERSARALFEHVAGLRIDVDRGALLNVNTEADLARARARVAGSEDEG